MTSRTDLPDFGTAQLPAVIARNSRIVEEGFWTKLLKLAGKLPFAEDLAAAYFCATDAGTPTRVRALLIAALAYFVTPIDLIPDFVAGLGYTDDAAVLAAAIGLVSGHIRQTHRHRARAVLGIPEPDGGA
jgi:uncharacterized membrane protein YkvA (DUF1232 family)